MEEKDILKHIDHDDGMRVPEGYFADFEARMAASLPEQPWEKASTGAVIMEAPRSLWQRVRPYVYMAAMFAGIWLMMHIFSIATPQSPEQRLGANPVLAEALVDDAFVEDLDLDDDEDIDEIYDEMYREGMSIDGLRHEAFKDESRM